MQLQAGHVPILEWATPSLTVWFNYIMT